MAQCSSCGRDNPDYSNFCIHCGAKLTRPPDTASHESHEVQAGPLSGSEAEQFAAHQQTLDVVAEGYEPPTPEIAAPAGVSEREIGRRAPAETNVTRDEGPALK